MFFRRLTQFGGGANGQAFLDLFAEAPPETRDEAANFLSEWRALTAGDDFAARLAVMRASNPIVIARNHRVEQALASANEGDSRPAAELCAALKNPFAEPSPRASGRRPRNAAAPGRARVWKRFAERETDRKVSAFQRIGWKSAPLTKLV